MLAMIAPGTLVQASRPLPVMLTNLTAYWRFEESSGVRADVVGVSHLSAINTPASAAGRIGNCVDLEAGSVQYLSTPDSAAVSMGDIAVHCGAWVQLESKPASQMVIHSQFENVGVDQRAYQLIWSNSADRFLVNISGDGLASTSATANTFGAPSLATWYFVEWYHDPVANLIGIAVNGGAWDTAAHTTGIFNSTAAFLVGARAPTVPTAFWDGLIDEMYIRKALPTADERAFMYNGAVGRTYPFLT